MRLTKDILLLYGHLLAGCMGIVKEILHLADAVQPKIDNIGSYALYTVLYRLYIYILGAICS